MTRAKRLRDRTVLALVGTALAATCIVVAFLALVAFSGIGGGLPADLASEVLLVGVTAAVVSAVFAVPFGLLALRNRDLVDEVFLVHQSGLLVVHLSKNLKSEKDRDVVAGMLTAVQSFILEAFANGPSRELRQMDFGKRKILLHKGFHTYLAVIVRGRRPAGFTSRMKRALGTVERAYWRILATWDGRTEPLDGADDLLRRELIDVRLRTLAKDAVDTAVDRVTAAIVSRWQRSRAPELQEAGSPVPSPRERATDLLERPEACDLDENYHELIWSALEQIEEGRFTLAGATNVYLAIAMQKSPRPSVAGWWDEVLLTVRDALRTWPWDPVTQAWIETPAPPNATPLPPPPLDDVPKPAVTVAPDAEPVRSAPARRRD